MVSLYVYLCIVSTFVPGAPEPKDPLGTEPRCGSRKLNSSVSCPLQEQPELLLINPFSSPKYVLYETKEGKDSKAWDWVCEPKGKLQGGKEQRPESTLTSQRQEGPGKLGSKEAADTTRATLPGWINTFHAGEKEKA